MDTVWSPEAMDAQARLIVNMWDAAGIIGNDSEAHHVLSCILGTGKCYGRFVDENISCMFTNTHSCVCLFSHCRDLDARHHDVR